MLTLRLPEEIEQRLEELAKESGRTKASHAREAILRYVEDLEDAQLAERRADEFHRSEARSVPLDDVIAQYG